MQEDLISDVIIEVNANINVAEILLPTPLGQKFSYIIPDDFAHQAKIGSYVMVPFGKAQKYGVIWQIKQSKQSDIKDAKGRKIKLKEIIHIMDFPAMNSAMMEYLSWVASYNMASLGMVLKMALGGSNMLDSGSGIKLWQLNHAINRVVSSNNDDSNNNNSKDDLFIPDESHKLTDKQQALISYLVKCKNRAATTAQIKDDLAIGQAVIKAVEAKGLVSQITLAEHGFAHKADHELIAKLAPRLNEQQAMIADDIKNEYNLGDAHAKIKPQLIDGVTGSGKTEIYFDIIADILKQNKQALVLLPEIALTSQWLSRCEARFGLSPAIWHSDTSRAKKRKIWKGVVQGSTRLIVGARSALFLPYSNLGLIVVDEEHEQAFKQEEGVVYHGRDMAVLKGNIENIPVILASATPSLETIYNCKQGKYQHHILSNRHGGAVMPEICLVDMRNAHKANNKQNNNGSKWISARLQEAIANANGKGEQALLYLNRRGFAPLTLCRSCGHRFECPDCTAWLVLHQEDYFRKKLRGGQMLLGEASENGALLCHHCGYHAPAPSSCPECGAEDSIISCGPGVERLQAEVEALFPKLRIGLMTSDNMTSSAKISELVQKMENGEIDILIGTQMVVKGYHFPKLTVVGVIDADMGLAGGDIRASERSFQALLQAIGRAGREKEQSGKAYLQTFIPEHAVMQAILQINNKNNDQDGREQFINTELEMRQMANMPPFSKLAALIVSAPSERLASDVAAMIARAVPYDNADIRVLGPAPAPLFKLRGQYRYRFLLQSLNNKLKIQLLISKLLVNIAIPSGAKVKIDIDPYNFM